MLSTSTPIRLQLSDREECRQTDRTESAQMDGGRTDREKVEGEREVKGQDRRDKDVNFQWSQSFPY